MTADDAIALCAYREERRMKPPEGYDKLYVVKEKRHRLTSVDAKELREET